MKRKRREPSERDGRAPALNSEDEGLDRRAFVKLLPALGAAGLAASNLSLPAAAQTPTPAPTPLPSP